MDLLTLIKTGFSLDYNLLQRLIVDRLARTSALYPDRLVPKDHFTMHLLDFHFQEIGARNEEKRNCNKYVDCFCLERKHKTCNRAISHTNNTRCYEKTMMQRVWIIQKRQWMEIGHFKAQLSGPPVEVAASIRAALPFEDVAGASNIAFEGMKYAVNDVVLANDEIYMVAVCIIGDGQPYLLARRMPRVSTSYSTATLCQHCLENEIVALDTRTKIAVLAKAWCYEKADQILVLHHELKGTRWPKAP